MARHISFRVAWHDNKWNGMVCKDPRRNIYCRGNYSLLSPRIQRRIDLIKEQDAVREGATLQDLMEQKQYLPPCYWGINTFGNTACNISDYHPFCDIKSYHPRFGRVPPLEDALTEYSGFTWYFLLGLSDVEDEKYVPRPILNSRVKEYLDSLKADRSIVFFYVNYSNPVSGNDYKYVLVGAGLLKDDVPFPKEFDIPEDVERAVQASEGMSYFNKLAWQFKVSLNKESAVLLPYHEYIDYIYSFPVDKRDDKWDKLNQISVEVDERSLIQHFKYVSRQLTHDKAIYLLYSMKKKIEKMKEHGIVDYDKIAILESRVNNLLKKAWSERGRYPGFKSVVGILLRNDFGSKSEVIINLVTDTIVEEYGSLENYLTKNPKIHPIKKTGALEKAFRLVSENLEKIAFLAQFDLTKRQFENVLTLLRDLDYQEAKNNPYLILERYYFKHRNEEVRLEDSDFGLGLYNFDIALIPDFDFADWPTEYNAECPERLRAVVKEILTDSALSDGSSCLYRTEILEKIEEYPLYYINERFKVDIDRLISYEQTPVFQNVFLIQSVIGKDDVTYQLRTLREVEDTIESFLEIAFNKTYPMSDLDKKGISEIVVTEKQKHGLRLLEEERMRLYSGVHENGFFAVTGKAGSGKTSAIINLIAKFLEDDKYPIYVFTPTGKANLVIKRRLTQRGLKLGPKLQVSTIHRFLFTALFGTQFAPGFKDAFELREKVERILDGRFDLIYEYKKAAKKWQFNPGVVIIDECSMVDELVLALLFCMLNPTAIKHFIIVGDERQLPPIGVGKPLVDIIYALKKKGLESKTVRLESSLRFDPNSSLGMFSEQFGETYSPLPSEIAETLAVEDEHFKLIHFSEENIKNVFEDVLRSIGSLSEKEKSIFDLFADVFEEKGEIDLDRV
jgi:exodeoxyribonuclease V alpha subunit